MSLLDHVKYPEDLRSLSRDELDRLVDELRARHIDVLSEKGGHFGASLGVAELTVALHYVYDTPRDQIVWDTGHQAYIHKMLTGRNEIFRRSAHGVASPRSCGATSLSTTPSELDTRLPRSRRLGALPWGVTCSRRTSTCWP